MNTLQWNFILISNIFIQQNAFDMQKVIWETLAILLSVF